MPVPIVTLGSTNQTPSLRAQHHITPKGEALPNILTQKHLAFPFLRAIPPPLITPAAK